MTKANDQLTKANVIWAQEADGGILLLIKTEAGNSENYKIITQGYDKDNKKWIPDKDAMAKATEIAKLYGGDINDPNSFVGKEIEVYVSGDRVSHEPIPEYIRFAKLTPTIARKIQNAGELETTIFSEFKGLRFNVGVKMPTGAKDDEGNDVYENYRISSFVIPPENDDEKDKVYSVKYTTKSIDSYRKEIEEENIPANIIPEVEKAIDDLLVESRAAKVESLKEVLGKSIDDMIESGETIKVTIEAVTGDFNYLKAFVVTK